MITTRRRNLRTRTPVAEARFFNVTTTRSGDLGILPANEARQAALEWAQETGEIVHLRDVVTDAIMSVVKPMRRRAA